MTNKSADRNAEATYKEKQKTKEGWGWVNLISDLWKVVEQTAGSHHFTDRQVSVVREEIHDTIVRLHDHAEVAFLLSTRRVDYADFLDGKHPQQLLRGIITPSEYWQEFARFCADRQVI